MIDIKPALTSKTVLISLGIALVNAAAYFGILPTQFGSIDDGTALTVFNTIAALIAAWTRKTATAKLV